MVLELEYLAVVFACQKFDQYIFGKVVQVETDHKPLEISSRNPFWGPETSTEDIK